MDQKFVNISERYGERVEVTIADYEELNPGGHFEIVGDEIREYSNDPTGGYVVIARKQ